MRKVTSYALDVVVILIMIVIGMIIILGLSEGQAKGQTPAQIELACPANNSPLPYVGQTVDVANSKYRQWACYDRNGRVNMTFTNLGATTVSASDPEYCPSGSTFDVCVNNAIAAIPSSGGTVDARGLSGNQQMNGSIILGSDSKPIMLYLPTAIITRTANSSFKYYNGSWVEGTGNCNGGYYSNCTVIIGSLIADSAFVSGAGSNTGYIHLANFYVHQTAATAVGIDFTTAIKSTIDYVSVLSDAGTALTLGGTDSCACYNEFRGDDFRGGLYGVKLLDTANQNNFYGGTIWSGGTAVYQESGANGSGVNNFYGVDTENSGIGYDIDGYSDMILNPYIESVTTPFKLESGATGNWIQGYGVKVGSVMDSSGNTQNFYMGFDTPDGSSGLFPRQLAVSKKILIGGGSWGNNPTDQLYSLGNIFAGGYTPFDDLSINYEGFPQSYGYLGHAGLDVSRLVSRDLYAWNFTTQQVGQPSAPTLACDSSGSGITYTYHIVGHTRSGGDTLPSSAATIQCPNIPSAGHPVTITPSNLTGIWSDVWSWDILKGDTAHSLCLSAQFGANASNCSDIGQATSGYTAPSRDSTGDAKYNNAGSGFHIKSPDGAHCALITLDNAGAIKTTSETCW